MSKLPSSSPWEAETTASLLHALQTPLTSLRIRLENALRAPWCGPECSEALEPCLRDVREASQMIHDLLVLEVDSANGPTTEREPVQLADLVSQAVQSHDVIAEAKGVSLVLGTLPAVQVMADPGELRRIFVNLLDNAIRHTGSGGTVRVRIELADGDAVLQVIDNGPGIAAEHQSRIFERFYQVDRSADRAKGGVGLGLAIARSLAERNGAHLDVQSTPGKGSTFTLRLPVAATNP